MGKTTKGNERQWRKKNDSDQTDKKPTADKANIQKVRQGLW